MTRPPAPPPRAHFVPETCRSQCEAPGGAVGSTSRPGPEGCSLGTREEGRGSPPRAPPPPHGTPGTSGRTRGAEKRASSGRGRTAQGTLSRGSAAARGHSQHLQGGEAGCPGRGQRPAEPCAVYRQQLQGWKAALGAPLGRQRRLQVVPPQRHLLHDCERVGGPPLHRQRASQAVVVEQPAAGRSTTSRPGAGRGLGAEPGSA